MDGKTTNICEIDAIGCVLQESRLLCLTHFGVRTFVSMCSPFDNLLISESCEMSQLDAVVHLYSRHILLDVVQKLSDGITAMSIRCNYDSSIVVS